MVSAAIGIAGTRIVDLEAIVEVVVEDLPVAVVDLTAVETEVASGEAEEDLAIEAAVVVRRLGIC